MNLEVIFFDMGSTLVYPKDPWKSTFRRADQVMLQTFQQAGIALNNVIVHPERETFIEGYYSLPDEGHIERTSFTVLSDLLVSKGHANVPEALIRTALDAFYAVIRVNWTLEKDARPTLQTLTEMGLRLGIISNASDDKNAQQLIDRDGIRPFFEFIITSAAHGIRKPEASIFNLALDHFGVEPEKAIMIGDTLEADIEGANALGIYSIWITRRAHMPPDGELIIQPQAIVTTLAELPNLLQDLRATA